MNWKKDDTAIVWAEALLDSGHINGQQVQLISFEGSIPTESAYTDWWLVAADDGNRWAREICFRKPYDGNELCEWSDVIWQPKELVVTNTPIYFKGVRVF